MQHVSHELFDIGIVFICAQIASYICTILRQPSVVGQILVGCLIGPFGFALLKSTVSVHALSELGAVLLLFSVGLETRINEMWRVGRSALFVGCAGVIVPFIAALCWSFYQSFPLSNSLFVASCFVATSAGITAQVLKELGVIQALESRIILGAAIVDDILAMFILGAVTSIHKEGGINVLNLILVLGQAVLFLAFTGVLGFKIIKNKPRILDHPTFPHSAFVISLALCLILAILASQIGLAAIIGAFLAGIILAEYDDRQQLEHQLHPLLVFMVPFFFVVTGASININIFSDLSTVFSVLTVTGIAIVSKFIGGAIGSYNIGLKSALRVGVGMVPRGEVGLIIAAIGKSSKIFDEKIFGILVMMSLFTSIITPPILKMLFIDIKPQQGLYGMLKLKRKKQIS
jgi:Kef-type K+ transport system membrane component KefB